MEKTAAVPPKRPWYFVLTFAWTIWADWWCFLAVVLVRALWGQRFHGIDWSAWVETRKGSWLAKKMKYTGVTLGRGGVLRAGKAGDLDTIDQPVEFHEHRHVHQFQVTQLITAVHCAYSYFVCGASLWTFALLPIGSALAYMCAMLVALLRGERWYRDNIFERSAYAQTELWEERND